MSSLWIAGVTTVIIAWAFGVGWWWGYSRGYAVAHYEAKKVLDGLSKRLYGPDPQRPYGKLHEAWKDRTRP